MSGRWQDVVIVECGEPLVEVRGPRIVPWSIYREAGKYENAISGVWMRQTAAEKIVAASELLPEGLGLMLWDGWRPVELQAELYQEYREAIHQQSGLEGFELDVETQRFVSLPSTDPQKPSPHLTGGTMDLSLASTEDGGAIEMGGEFDELGPRSSTVFYELASSEENLVYRDRRRLLCQVMTTVGFSNYPEEWWHFDFGNQFHHNRVGGPARYGPVLELPAS